MFFHRNLSDCEYNHVSRTLFSILAAQKYALVWMVTIPPPISNFSKLLTKYQGTIPTILFSFSRFTFFHFHPVVRLDDNVHCTAVLYVLFFFFVSSFFFCCVLMITKKGFWLVHVPFGNIVKFIFLAKLPQNPISHLAVSSFKLLKEIFASLQHSLLMWLIVERFPQH